ncbi:MAG: molybdenum cofactor biosynthesis protein MoaE [Deltaproteobacteria bacterium]|nr:molybdenum cofactor biosynthesis protein MoaE [Deltaproteobacteria bacterium]
MSESLITTRPISAAQLKEGFAFPDCGATLSFEGTVRNHHRGREVQKIIYEAYAPMAEKVLTEIMHEITTTHHDCRVKICHRIGELKVGDVAVVIVVASPHREAGFTALRFAIEEIKKRCPIWKKEFFIGVTNQ